MNEPRKMWTLRLEKGIKSHWDSSLAKDAQDVFEKEKFELEKRVGEPYENCVQIKAIDDWNGNTWIVNDDLKVEKVNFKVYDELLITKDRG